MAYPTDVTEPRVGVAAFAENDPASQLAQAAYLLLLGRELRRHRGQHKPPPREEPTDDDAADFDMPRIPAQGRRYRSPPLKYAAAELHEIARDLAVALQVHPTEPLAADLLHVCVARPDPVVKVAAAAAAFEISAEPRRLIAILAKATYDDDPLVRDLAATALARINPEHPALRRLSSGPRAPRSQGEAHTSLLVHGTFARTQAWWQPGGDFHTYLLDDVLPDLYAEPDRFEWSGGYSDAARTLAGADLKAWADDHAVADPLVMGHSHGANVIFIATTLGLAVRKAVLLSCPVRWPQYLPDFAQIRDPIVSIRVHLDLVILADGGGQRFDDPRVEENVLPVWFNHSATHDPANWQTYDVPSMILP